MFIFTCSDQDTGSQGEVTIATTPPQPVPGIRDKGHDSQITELYPAIEIHAMEKGNPLTGPLVFTMHKGSAEEAVKAD